jgi:hypothetical protein
MTNESPNIQQTIDRLKSRQLSALEIYAIIRINNLNLTFKEVVKMYNKGVTK